MADEQIIALPKTIPSSGDWLPFDSNATSATGKCNPADIINAGMGSSTITVNVANGGTGDATFTAYAVLCGGLTATGALQQVSGLGTSGYVLTSNGAGALPTWQPGGGGITVGTTTITSGTTTRVLYDNGGVVGEYVITGTGNVVMSASPTLTGVPVAPTAALATNTTQLATCAFVLANGGGMAIGGAVTSGTAGEILYVGAGPVLAQTAQMTFVNTGSAGGISAYIALQGTGGTKPAYFGNIVEKQLALTQNCHFDGTNWVYDATGFASGFRLSSAGAGGDSGFQLCLVASGTGGATISTMDTTSIGLVGLPGNQFIFNPGTYNPTLGTVAMVTVNPNNTTDNSATVQINANNAGRKCLVLQAFASQTNNTLEVQSSSGTVLFLITKGGWAQNIQGEAALTSSFTDATGTLGNTNISFNVIAGQSYRIEGYLIVSNTLAADGSQFDFNGGTATATAFDVAFSAVGSVAAGTVVSASLATVLNYTTNTGTDRVYVRGYLKVNAGGTFILRAATNTHVSGTMTLGAGSWLALTDTLLV